MSPVSALGFLAVGRHPLPLENGRKKTCQGRMKKDWLFLGSVTDTVPEKASRNGF
jgi:hypothetical protein